MPGFPGGAGRRTRTPDLLVTNQLLFRLSYTGIFTFTISPGVARHHRLLHTGLELLLRQYHSNIHHETPRLMISEPPRGYHGTFQPCASCIGRIRSSIKCRCQHTYKFYSRCVMQHVIRKLFTVYIVSTERIATRWWDMPDSNRRPRDPKSRALPSALIPHVARKNPGAFLRFCPLVYAWSG